MVAVAAAVALVAGGADLGWPRMLGAVGAITLLGASSGLTWVEDRERRWRLVRRLAAWFGVSATLLLGLPPVLGAWTLLVVPLLGVLSPEALGWVRRTAAVRQPPERDLDRRWRWTTQQLAARRADPGAVLALVEERARLLDELERRDPEGFDEMLVRSGWRERQDR